MCHLLGQSHQRAAHGHVGGGAAGFAERLGDLGVGQTELDPGDDRLPLLGTQPVHRPLVAIEHLLAHRLLERRRFRRLQIAGQGVGGAAPAVHPGDVANPIPERGPDVVAERAGMSRFERRDALKHLDQGFLHQVLGVHGAAGRPGQPAVGPAAEPGFVAGEQVVDGGLVAVVGAQDQIDRRDVEGHTAGVGGRASATGAGYVHGGPGLGRNAGRANHKAILGGEWLEKGSGHGYGSRAR